MSIVRATLLVTAIVCALLSARIAWRSLTTVTLYYKDLMQEYVCAKAIMAGENPYTPIPDLIARHMPEAPPTNLRHSTPHMPLFLLISVPLAALRYHYAAALWIAMQVAMLLLSTFLLRSLIAPKASIILAFAIAMLCLYSGPLILELRLGQAQLILLPILCLAWIDLRAKREGRSGIWLGLLIALKLFAWPLVIYFALRRRWRIVASASAVVLGTNLLAVAVMGFYPVRDCYLKVGPEVSSIYRTAGQNFSAYALGRRLFEGIKLDTDTLEAPALLSSSFLASVAGTLAPLSLLICSLRVAQRAKDFDSAFGILICVSLLANPISWNSYLILAAIPTAIAAARIRSLHFPFWLTIGYCVVFFLLYQPLWTVEDVGLWLGARRGSIITLSPVAALGITMLPAAALLGLVWLLWWLDLHRPAQQR